MDIGDVVNEGERADSAAELGTYRLVVFPANVLLIPPI